MTTSRWALRDKAVLMQCKTLSRESDKGGAPASFAAGRVGFSELSKEPPSV